MSIIDGSSGLVAVRVHVGVVSARPRARPGIPRAVVAIVTLTWAFLMAAAVVTAEAKASTSLNWRPGAQATLPANSGADPEVDLQSVSCGAPGDCAAVGSYVGGRVHRRRLLPR